MRGRARVLFIIDDRYGGGLRDITKATGMGARARYLSGLIYIYNMNIDVGSSR